MARRARGIVAEGIYHVTRRSAGPVAMFIDDSDRTDFCNRLARTISKNGWICHSFCLMTTHYHLLLGVEEDALQPGMHALNGPYAQDFNRRHGRSGHLKGSPYGAREVTGETQLLRTVRYIARNPVRAGVCESPEEWIWSSYRGCAGYDSGFPLVTDDLVLGSLHENSATAQRMLRALVEIS